MKGKYFLRGLGFGIFVTALILAVAFVFYDPDISDAEIERRAREMGMAYLPEAETATSEETTSEDETSENVASEDEASENVVSEDEASENVVSEDTASEETAAAEDKIESANETIANSNTADTSYGSNATSGSSQSSTSSGTASSSSALLESTEKVRITVSSGQSSETVAANLYKAGVITDPNAFNQYLESNGYDRRIRNGSYDIAKGSTFEQIANAIAR